MRWSWRARQILFGGRGYNSGMIETAPSTQSLLSRRSAPIGSHSVIPLIIPPLRQRTDTPGSAPLDFPRKHAIFLSNTHSWYGFNSLLSRGSWVRVPAGAPLSGTLMPGFMPAPELPKLRTAVFESPIMGSNAHEHSTARNHH